MHRVKLFSLLVMALQLQGCFSWTNRTSEGIVRDGFARRWEDPYQPQALYCYRTLGDNDCYDRPLPQREQNRLEAAYTPKVDLNSPQQQRSTTIAADNVIKVDPLKP